MSAKLRAAVAALLSILLFSAVILCLMYGILGEMNLRDLKYENKRQWVKILEDRALAEHQARREKADPADAVKQ